MVKVNYSLYLIVVIIVSIIIFFTFGIIIFLLNRIIRRKTLYKWPVKYLQYTLPIISFGFYGQIFLLFTTAFYCKNTESPTSPYLKCRDTWFNKYKPFAFLAVLIHFLISYLTNTLYYQPTFIKCKTDLLQKTNSFPDVFFLFVKIIIILIFILDKGTEDEHWTIIGFLIIITGINSYCTLFYQNRKNIILLNLNNIFCLILFLGFLILLIGKIFKYWDFNGSIFLLASLVTIILLIFIFYKSYNPNFFQIEFKAIRDPDEYLQYVLKFCDFVRNKNNSRENLIIMRGLISSMEDNCIDAECPLKKYLINLEKGIDSEYYLLQFVEILYQYGIARFPYNIYLKNYYSSFLIMDMNNKKKAVVVINDIKDKIESLQMNYSIYRCLKVIENYSSPFINKNNSIFNYRKDVQDFKNNIENISLLYYDFLSLLLSRRMDSANSFENISRIGYRIQKLLRKTEKSFDKLINIKIDNFEIIKLYSEFSENILNNEDEIEKCKNFLKIKNTNNIIEIQEKDYSNFNLEILKENDNFYYLIILAKNKELGIITDCSKNLCNLLGYTKDELIGKHIHFLLPKIFHIKHKEVMEKKSEEHKLNFFEKLYTNSIYSPEFIEKDIYCVAKSKLLIPLSMKIYLVNNEENELVYIAEFTRELNFANELLKKIKLNNETQKYCVLTNKNFIIQSLTANCLKFLKFKYEDIGANYSILNFIKQFRQDYISAIKAASASKYSHLSNTGIFSIKGCDKTNFLQNNDNNKIVVNDIKRTNLKKEVFYKKYNKKCKITWSNSVNDLMNSSKFLQNYNQFKNSLIGKESTISFDDFKLLNNFEVDLYMEAKNIIIGGELIGYYFYFNKIYNPKPNTFFNYKVENRITTIDKKNEAVKKSKKYQVVIKSQQYLNMPKGSSKNVLNNIDRPGFISFIQEKDDLTKYRRKSVAESKIKARKKNSRTHISSKEIHEQIFERVREDDITINGEFIPMNPFFLDFDHNEGFYLTSTTEKRDKLNEILKEGEEKMNKIIKIKIEKKRVIKKLFNGTDSEEEEEEEEENKEFTKSSSIFSSSSNLNHTTEKKTEILPSSISSQNSIVKKNRVDRKIQKMKFNKNIEDFNSIFQGRQKAQVKKMFKRSSIIIKQNDYYHFQNISLRRIKYLIYNYQREMVEEQLHANYSEIENILYKIKNEKPIDIGRDEDYPNIIIQDKYNDKKNENEKTGRKMSNEDYKIMNKDKILKRKIIEAINNYKDEIPVKNLKKLILVSFFVMFGYGFFNFYFNTSYYSTFMELINLIQSSLRLKYCNLFSIFYIRELTLLNFNISDIKGGSYTGVPANNKEQYSSYIYNELTNLYIENHALIKIILGTSYPFSKNSTYYLTEELFNVKFLRSDKQIFTVKYDMKKIIIAYNTAFSNLATTNNKLEQNHDDLQNYFMNSFGEFDKSFDMLYDIFNYELELLGKKIKTYIYLIISFVFISYSVIYFFGLKYFLSSNIIRINYIKIFYNINSKTLKDLMKNCLNLIDKFKYIQQLDKSQSDYGEEKENISNKNKIRFNEINEISLNDGDINQKSQNIYLSFLTLFFIIFFFIFMFFLFFYFVYISKYFYDLYKNSLDISFFSKHFFILQFSPMKIYNAYREYMFDNNSIISNFTPYEYLIHSEIEIYNSIHDSMRYTNPILRTMMKNNEKVFHIFVRNFCSFDIIKEFNFTSDCSKKFGYFSRLSLDKTVFYFLEELRLKKNLIRYFLETYNVVGNLTEYNKDEMINIYNEKSINNKTIFRLDLFNNQSIHSDINKIYFFIILQNMKENLFIIDIYSIDGKNSHFILLIIVYILTFSLIILLFFIPMIKFLNKQIYKAKNILSIVPINALLYQRNTRYLFKFFND